jgi:hypothetical protein
MSDLRHPVGPFQPPETVTAAERGVLIGQIEEAPARLRAAVAGLDAARLDTPYRPGGWTVRQVVHHVPDSHINAYVRFRLALTEEAPTIKPYEEGRWAELPDARTADPALSLDLLEALHRRWTLMLRALDDDEWQRAFHHPVSGPYPLTRALALYAWHGRHHVAHITSLRERQGWA